MRTLPVRAARPKVLTRSIHAAKKSAKPVTAFCYIPPMRLVRPFLPVLIALPLFAQPSVTLSLKPGRDAGQPIDEEYTRKIREYTTETFFNSPLTDYLPASRSEEHTSELQSLRHLVCRLLLEKKKKKNIKQHTVVRFSFRRCACVLQRSC